MKFDNCKVFNIEGALRGMRNPKNSWNLSDSYFGIIDDYDEGILDVVDAYIQYDDPDLPYDDDRFKEYMDKQDQWCNYLISNGTLTENELFEYRDVAYIGPKDMKLAKQLIAAGPEHRKFLRQIMVSMDITAPLYWWKEFDTYKVATVADSCSTMHKLASYPITLDSFETIDFDSDIMNYKRDNNSYQMEKEFIEFLEYLRKKYLETKDKRYWKELVRWLPNGWLQTRTWTGNYETLRSMYHQRKNHKLIEWHAFCDFIETLPYAKEFIME